MPRISLTIFFLFLVAAGCLLGHFYGVLHFTFGTAMALMGIIALNLFRDKVQPVLERFLLPFFPELVFLVLNFVSCFLLIVSVTEASHYLNFLYLLPLLNSYRQTDFNSPVYHQIVLVFFLSLTVYSLRPPQPWKIFIQDLIVIGGLSLSFSLLLKKKEAALIKATTEISKEHQELLEAYNQLKSYTEVLEFTAHDLDRKTLNLSEINTLTNILNIRLPLESIIARISSFFSRTFHAEKVWILFLKEGAEIQTFSFFQGETDQYWFKEQNPENWFYFSLFQAAHIVNLQEEELSTLANQIFWTSNKPRNLTAIPLFREEGVFGAVILGNIRERLLQEDLNLLQIISSQAAIALERVRIYDELEDNYLATIKALASSIEAKDPYTRGHSERVTKFSIAIGEMMGLTAAELTNLRYGGLLHDIGKIGIPEMILNKPAPLTFLEYEAIRRHPIIGAEIVSPVAFLKGTLHLIRNHHERFDGTGYPDGLKGYELPLEIKILTVCDAFDAMHSDRPYRKALSLEDCKKELLDKSSAQFDPEVVGVLLELLNAQILV